MDERQDTIRKVSGKEALSSLINLSLKGFGIWLLFANMDWKKATSVILLFLIRINLTPGNP